MNTIQMRRTLLSFILGGLMILATFSVAAADGPVVVGPIHLEGSLPLGVDCGSFEIIDNYTQDQTTKLFFDETGSLYKVITELSGTDTFTNSVTGKAYSGSYHSTFIVDPVLRRGVYNGVVVRLTVPGDGAVFLDVGRIVIDRQGNVYFEAGPHQFYDGDFAGLCAALA